MPPATAITAYPDLERLPLFSIPKNCTLETDETAMAAYYANRPLMWRNIAMIGICNLGWSTVFALIGPLMALRVLDIGVRENIQATITSANSWAVSFLVMWFSWMSDHTISRLGRRKPYLFIAAPFIIVPIVIFPLVAQPQFIVLLIALQVVSMFFMDMKGSTFPLLNIDCVPRDMLARASSVLAIAGGVTTFITMRSAGYLLRLGEWVPYAIGGTVMGLATLAAFFIKEPPIRHPAAESFKPWSTFKVASQDKRIFVLMIGVALVAGYAAMSNQWLWFFAKKNLGMERTEIFNALSWVGLVNIVAAYPVAWVIDRWGSLRVVIVFYLAQIGCFIGAMNIATPHGLLVLAVAQTIFFPLYSAADISVYKACPPKDVGSITSTCAFFKNGAAGCMSLASGWLIFWMGGNFRVGFVLGIIVATIGMALYAWHQGWLVKKPVCATVDVSEKSGAQRLDFEAV